MKFSLPMALLATFVLWAQAAFVQAELKMPALFTDHMVLQRDLPIQIWGTAQPKAEVTVKLNDQQVSVSAEENGKWKATLEPMAAGGPHQVTVASGGEEKVIRDVLVGEVWICSGQSNMQWAVDGAYDGDLVRLKPINNQIRLISVPQVGTQEPQDDFQDEWRICTPDVARGFSAVGYFFGKEIQETLGVPVGLIDNAWGGSAAEAWVARGRLEEDPRYAELLSRWKSVEDNYDHDAEMTKYRERVAAWQEKADAAKEAGKPAPPRPRAPRNQLTGNHRPANIYNGVLKPTIGYGIRGVIWYQGESNSGRAYQYRHLFPLMIQNWREDWGQGNFPFYWVQLADFRAELDAPAESAWAELREAQTMTLDKLDNTGQAVIIDLGEGKDIHPRNKRDVALRLARIALARDYGYDIAYQSPRFKSMEAKDGKVEVEFETFGSRLQSFDTKEVQGFAIAGEDKQFVNAQAEVAGSNKVVVWAEGISNPVAVRYAWADNPVCNLQNQEGLPATPFRSDDWPGVTANAN